VDIALCSTKEIVSVVRDVATVLGVFGALLFFGYKILAGWMLINLNVAIATERRTTANDQDDHLVIKVVLEKGKVDAARLLGVEMRLSPVETNEAPFFVREVSNTQRVARNENGRINWDAIDTRKKYLNLSTEERAEFAEHFRVPPDVVYRVDVVVTGDRFRDRVIPSLSQWRASAIVLPAKSTSASAT